ncbi:MAG: N-acetylglucosamine-6-phosphate deacetylase [Treponema sp.]|jgi:N-acetylglucosamine-6-phosphate deacetylase|nr:N-acetylglucosamine-6-phosphate deacetylase [Treponema sp.]
MMNPICLYNGRVMTGFSVMEKCAVLIENGSISDVFSQKRLEKKNFGVAVKKIDVKECIIAPGFIDTHIHGFGGFGTDDAFESSERGAEAVLEMSASLAEYGVTAFNPTVYPSEPKTMIKNVKIISGVMGREKGAQIMGLHLEGPFLSPERPGIMKPETLSQVDIQFMEELWDASDRKIVNMTVAPELKNMRELALFCIKKGIVLQAGHTNAEYENMVEGMQAGILHSTHLFNAMRRMDHRDPNAVGAILIHPEMSCEIIADGCHIHPELYKLILRDKPVGKIVLITDALKCTEQKQGPFFANGEEVEFRNGVFYRKNEDVIAGSSLTMIQGIKNLVNFGFSLEDAVKTASFNPANIMRYRNKGAIIPGKDADITVFDKDFSVKAVIIGGELKKNLFQGE